MKLKEEVLKQQRTFCTVFLDETEALSTGNVLYSFAQKVSNIDVTRQVMNMNVKS